MLYPGLEDYAVTELVTTMFRWSTAVFALCGSSNAPTPSDASLNATLRRIAEAVYKLARVTREEILSTTFEVLTVDGGVSFEPGRMLNKMREGEYEGDDHASQLSAFTDGHYGHTNGHSNGNGMLTNGNGRANGTPDSGRVLCTTELGLRCTTRRDARTSGFPDTGAEGDAFESRMLLLPKVLLDSAMDVIERG